MRFTWRSVLRISLWLGSAILLLLVGIAAAYVLDGPRRKAQGLTASRYAEYASSYELASQRRSFGVTTCYGQRWDAYSQQVFDDIGTHFEDRPHLERMASAFDRLSREHERAIARPWSRLAPGPLAELTRPDGEGR